jgi:site-specific recombinase XerC
MFEIYIKSLKGRGFAKGTIANYKSAHRHFVDFLKKNKIAYEPREWTKDVFINLYYINT